MGLEISGLLGLLILALNVWAIIKTVQSSIPDHRKVLWVVIIILLPVIGFILWYLLANVIRR
ncbi:MAG: PLDc_N domain-containing protein [Rhizobiales bacterium]|nr:PLDc_N domain-containing protein [Hyphomicrobiales bacterium]